MVKSNQNKQKKCSLEFQAVRIDALFPVLDALSWVNLPSMKQIAQFAGIDVRTVGKLIKNCIMIGIVQKIADDTYSITMPYPFRGSVEQKDAVIREALIRMPLITNIRQFRVLGDSLELALRKAATIIGVENFASKAFDPLMKWAQQMNVLEPTLRVGNLLDEAVATKEKRHRDDKKKIVAFVSHSSKDKPFIRQLASDLTEQGITVWIDEQMIKVGDSIVEKISQGLAESDYFLIALSENSVNSEWVKKELNQALLKEIEAREVKILPLKLSECEIPLLIKEKKFADFSVSYKSGLNALLAAMKGDSNQ